MTSEQALQVFNQLIEQTMANGLFKTLADLDAVRSAHSVLLDAIKTKKLSVDEGK